MQFSFTSDVLGNILLEKSKTIEIKGIFEKSQNSQYSEYEKLQQFSVLDTSSGLLHHKVFIIDNETVITGSMNPSKNGNENNDENVLIIHNTEIAQLYVDEFEKLK
jgi:phosphatidylserine/phosphatidylglycerophosphate/cardiolipin synthase-like enzyme